MPEPEPLMILHGGPLDGKVMPIVGRPDDATKPAPRMYLHMQKGFILYYNLHDPDAMDRPARTPVAAGPPEVDGYHYDYSHATPRHSAQ
jgi:hypothetical protein